MRRIAYTAISLHQSWPKFMRGGVAKMRCLTCLLLFLLTAFCLHPSLTQANSRETVFVSILPQKFFLEQITGNSLDIEVMVLPGASPATYEPKPSQMRQLAKSRAYFAIGVPFEKAWLEKIRGVNPAMQVIHTDEGITKMAMAAIPLQQEDKHQHDHNHHHDHDHSGMDPHIWLSPPLVKQQATTITAALAKLFPDQAAFFTENNQKFAEKIDDLDTRLSELLAPQRGKQFMVFHPSWGYFAHEYGLKQVSIEIEGKDPKPAQVQHLIKQAKEHNIKIIFAQKQFSTKNASIIAKAIGGRVVLVDPLAYDWFANLQEIAVKLKEATQ